jgi:acyl-CoA thioesterase-2
MSTRHAFDRKIEREGLFAFETLAPNHFRTAPIPSGLLRLYGGQVVAQALAAAQLTVDPDRMAHSCHAYFIRPGKIDLPLDFHVVCDSDGRSFSARRVTVQQDNETILTMGVSMHIAEQAPSHQQAMPEVPPPEQLPTMESMLHELADTLPDRHAPFWLRDHLVEWRPVEPLNLQSGKPGPALRHIWLRMKDRWDAPPFKHQWLFAYASDLHLLHTGLIPLGIGASDNHLQTASLDHSIWFHDSFRADEWLLYALDSPVAAHSLTLGTGTVFTSDGKLVANTAQQGLIRMLRTPRTGKL